MFLFQVSDLYHVVGVGEVCAAFLPSMFPLINHLYHLKKKNTKSTFFSSEHLLLKQIFLKWIKSEQSQSLFFSANSVILKSVIWNVKSVKNILFQAKSILHKVTKLLILEDELSQLRTFF